MILLLALLFTPQETKCLRLCVKQGYESGEIREEKCVCYDTFDVEIIVP